MKRLFAEHAYSDDRIERCFWAEEVPNKLLRRPPLSGPHKTEVAIIGSGFTGLSAAFELARNGVSVTVLDSKFPGWGASGRNGGFCCLGGSKLDDAQMDRAFGKPERLLWRQTEKRAIEHVAKFLKCQEIEADTHSIGETILAHTASRAGFKNVAASVQENYGLAARVMAKDELRHQGLDGPFHGAMTIPSGFGLHPRKYLLGLLRAAESEGALVVGDAPVTGFQKIAGGYQLECGTIPVECDRVILATNGYSSDDLPDWMAGRYLPAQSSVIVTRPLEKHEREAAGWTSRQMAYDTRNLLHYFRLMPDNRFLFGMRGGLRSTPRSDQGIQRAIRRDFEKMFPAWRDVETPYYWSGMVCLAPALTPFCAPVEDMPGVFAAFGYHGNGVAMGSYCGVQVAQILLGRNSEHQMPAFLKKPPKRFPLGRFRKALLWPAYAMAGIADR
ncbi:FAD-dependent oxidoreductase [Rhodobacteraceae bacterium D3-12]|nr:FAD-dependent oxidoreductase [Rhodobacteraceae bacterium D3-12]